MKISALRMLSRFVLSARKRTENMNQLRPNDKKKKKERKQQEPNVSIEFLSSLLTQTREVLTLCHCAGYTHLLSRALSLKEWIKRMTPRPKSQRCVSYWNFHTLKPLRGWRVSWQMSCRNNNRRSWLQSSGPAPVTTSRQAAWRGPVVLRGTANHSSLPRAAALLLTGSLCWTRASLALSGGIVH